MNETQKLIVLGQDGAIPYIIADGMAHGHLPNFARLAQIGVFSRILPHPSAVTPGNWAHVSTGALPWTTGISEFALHRVGEPFTDRVHAFGREECQAQTAWEALGKRGLRSATISYPHGRPRAGDFHAAIGGDGAPGEFCPFTTVARSRGLFTDNLEPGDPYGWREHERLVLDKADAAAVIIGPKAAGEIQPWLDLSATLVEGGWVRFTKRDDGQVLGKARAGEWSPWIECAGRHGDVELTCEFRIRPVVADASGRRLALYVSALQAKDAFADPAELSASLRRDLGPYTEPLSISSLVTGWIDPQGMIEEFRAQALWQARAALHLTRDLGYAAVFTKWHAFDKFYHFFFQKIDTQSPLYCPEEFEYYEGIHQQILQVADEMVGVVLGDMTSETLLLVISDHGLMPSRRHLYLNNFLANRGYLATTGDPDARGQIRVDWRRTRAVAHPFTQVWINTKGRDPDGTVNPGDEYESLRDEIIAALRDWKDPDTGQHIMSQVFRIEDGAPYGLGAPTDGDIRFFCCPGYSVFRTTAVTADRREVAPARGPFLGDHGSCLPTARLGRGSETAMLFMAGPRVRQGYSRPNPMRISDILPTALTCLGWPLPQHSEGGVAMDCLEVS
jgi:predicted AlkP superfamily phosphohydrolase/phosphomutase